MSLRIDEFILTSLRKALFSISYAVDFTFAYFSMGVRFSSSKAIRHYAYSSLTLRDLFIFPAGDHPNS
jgi:hypothetical protein